MTGQWKSLHSQLSTGEHFHSVSNLTFAFLASAGHFPLQVQCSVSMNNSSHLTKKCGFSCLRTSSHEIQQTNHFFLSWLYSICKIMRVHLKSCSLVGSSRWNLWLVRSMKEERCKCILNLRRWALWRIRAIPALRRLGQEGANEMKSARDTKDPVLRKLKREKLNHNI